ncbi:hypothetical protein OEZ60_19085 [Defluviimonas sp. WL0024]|uniref:Uncharacterized protein n=2 Tax=Albidovulum TaxID=205889 RepID=A0ABT3J6V8_9RHOB|nr:MULTISPECIES: hypothetical protein [Defluviimonas]MCU9850103.1 hypothetical protein [Defluviimonas sp. WL0024]MCW3783422.1 hypothetical protein [Defluviimonas salinarum]
MRETRQMRGHENGFDHMDSKEAVRAFIAWWNEKSDFPFDDGVDEAEASTHGMAA